MTSLILCLLPSGETALLGSKPKIYDIIIIKSILSRDQQYPAYKIHRFIPVLLKVETNNYHSAKVKLGDNHKYLRNGWISNSDIFIKRFGVALQIFK